MRVINAGYEIISELNGEEILKHIERCARVCYKSEDRITDGSAEKMVAALLFFPLAMRTECAYDSRFWCSC